MDNEMVKCNGDVSVQATVGGNHLVAIAGLAVTGLCFIVFGAMKNGYGIKLGGFLFAPTNTLQSISA